MGPYGQDRRNLWFLMLHVDGSVTGLISRIEDVPQRPSPTKIATLIDALGQALTLIQGGSAALLLTRPGDAEPTDADLAWARDLRLVARARNVFLHPTFLATDEAVVLLERDPGLADAA